MEFPLGGEANSPMMPQESVVCYSQVPQATAGAIGARRCHCPYLVAFFVRRFHQVISNFGLSSFISTNTISEGDTRESSLDFIIKEGGSINYAETSKKWPGRANVTITLLSFNKGNLKIKPILNGSQTSIINRYLDDNISSKKPFQLDFFKGKSFEGVKIYGDGFIIDQKEKIYLIEKSINNANIIYPYLSGDDLSSNYDQKYSRYVINFFDWSEDEASKYLECFSIIKAKVYPERQMQKDMTAKKYWWQYQRSRPGLNKAIQGKKLIIVITKVSKYLIFSLIENERQIITNGVIVFAEGNFKVLSVLNCSLHTEWSATYGSTLESRFRYTPTDCLETFPFPQNISQYQKQNL